ncbi:MAG TPA: hypothetical protein VK522_13115 [Pseudolabrys sp.]|nr:hypothetical protein [Pseudolabrys sp.]
MPSALAREAGEGHLTVISPFATEMTHIIDGLNHAIDRTTIDPTVRGVLMAAWGSAHQSGDPRAERRALNSLNHSEWTWPWFEDWLRHFQSHRQWPYMWRQEQIPDALAERNIKALEDAAIGLLSHTIGTTVYRCRDNEKGHGRFLKQRGWDFVSLGCPVEDAIAAGNLATVDLDNWHTWPPFFPGDRSHMLARRATR